MHALAAAFGPATHFCRAFRTASVTLFALETPAKRGGALPETGCCFGMAQEA